MSYAADSKQCLNRILASVDLSILSKKDTATFTQRLEAHFPKLFERYIHVYGHQYDCYYHLLKLVETLRDGLKARKAKLRSQDAAKLKNPLWYREEEQVGMACYVDLLGPTLSDLHSKIPYFKALGITYLHLMPLYDAPKGDSDGGYAVSDYRKVNPSLGTIDELARLSDALQSAGIDLVLDFVFNHTSDEHAWAKAALAGDPTYQNYYYLFDDRTIPDQYEHALREIFPQVRRGSFTYNDTMGKWVWTTFNSFQWDLNYSNPEVFNAITSEMLFLANIGCAGLRLDALAFIWKEMGTNCENQPNAHRLIQAFNACLQIVAPAVVFKSEAIVHPDEVVKYIHKDECQLSYNPLLMALLWNSLATRKTRLLTHSLKKSFSIPHNTAWVNYVRCHDDIGWTFDDGVAHDLGINPHDHRYFLNQFYTGRFNGSFASGVPFAENPSNGDCRVCGSLASLCGLEAALVTLDEREIEMAIRRMLLLYGVTFAIGGIPLLYSSDELGLLNDYRYRDDEAKRHDDRWVNRIAVTQAQIDNALSQDEPAKTITAQCQRRVFNGLRDMLKIRKGYRVFGDASTAILDTGNPHCFAFIRQNDAAEKLLVICNFSEQHQVVDGLILQALNQKPARDLLSDGTLSGREQSLSVAPYQQCWWLTQ
ncbi:alpha-amylase family glycosyl hydrolase [Aestuariibacter sp. A3R04]|uniref:alpha-amylase family glycosyl hydrolase n=1 Tax=Aestuariibacter sp. A3R04 TaxID=2841571 RepID=UPI001C0A35CB|nr:alpha-amylase family glycosyl hydrolase [Aestuariibacter sp. A3R04]MBU3023570.1 alpha-glucosidase C-terminal domain-containing protein [Aestuariibacter sp. A3R04]